MEEDLLQLLSPQPRRLRVIENILRGRRSEATLFWAYNYHILGMLGARRLLTRGQWERMIRQWEQRGWVQQADQQAWLTSAGADHLSNWQREHYQSQFGAWAWVTNVDQYSQRLLLALQVISEFKHQHAHYVPVNLNEFEMQRVRQWVQGLAKSDLTLIETQITQLVAQLAQHDERLAIVWTYRLIGYHLIGWTERQAAAELAVTLPEVRLMIRDTWLFMATGIAQQGGPLAALMSDLINPRPITSSATKTIQAYQQGLTMEQISQRRHLKLSTVREHLLEVAILMPNQLQVASLIPPAVLAILKHYSDQPAVMWEYDAARFPVETTVAFFYFRLYQIMRCHQEYGDYKGSIA